jgi:hypothetical protein
VAGKSRKKFRYEAHSKTGVVTQYSTWDIRVLLLSQNVILYYYTQEFPEGNRQLDNLQIINLDKALWLTLYTGMPF